MHIQSMSGEWDHDRELYKRMGYDALFTAEEIAMFNGHKDFEHEFGYFDEGNDSSWPWLIFRGTGILF
jgi:hypothetical protein